MTPLFKGWTESPPPPQWCAGWGSTGSSYPLAVGLVMVWKQWRLGLNCKLNFQMLSFKMAVSLLSEFEYWYKFESSLKITNLTTD
jgi:hypothetical protein